MNCDLSRKELLALFLLLRRSEETLDDTLLNLLFRFEKELYHYYSIEEMENIESLYQQL